MPGRFVALLLVVASAAACQRATPDLAPPPDLEDSDGGPPASGPMAGSGGGGSIGTSAGGVIMSGGSPLTGSPACASAADCAPGQVCCFTRTGDSTVCQGGPCGASPFEGLSFQLCTTSGECLTEGDVCGSQARFGAIAGLPPGAVLPVPPDAGVCVGDAGSVDTEAGALDAGTADAGGAGSGTADGGDVQAGDAAEVDP
jgi:hypothetical protein